MIGRLLSWWRRDPHLARRATLAAIRQSMDLHPVEKGDHWRDRPMPLLQAPRRAEVPFLLDAGVPTVCVRGADQETGTGR